VRPQVVKVAVYNVVSSVLPQAAISNI